eukprot:m.16725 g.16725  ORF g.16725 m.16725 type:complete len:80 (+) comp11170_c0_seq1:183-422(+)
MFGCNFVSSFLVRDIVLMEHRTNCDFVYFILFFLVWSWTAQQTIVMAGVFHVETQKLVSLPVTVSTVFAYELFPHGLSP